MSANAYSSAENLGSLSVESRRPRLPNTTIQSSRMVRVPSFFANGAVQHYGGAPDYAGSRAVSPQVDQPTFIYPPPPHYYYSYAPPPIQRFQDFAPATNYAPPPPMCYPVPNLELQIKIRDQIYYYFSKENLVKDTYLRQKMDEQGWVPIELIASFPKMQSLTKNIQFILEALKGSHIVEVKGDKIRKRGDWKRWLIPPSLQIPCGLSFRGNRPASHYQNH